MAVLKVVVCPAVTGKVTVVTVGAAITPSQEVSALVTIVEAGITISALVESIVVCGIVPVPPEIRKP